MHRGVAESDLYSCTLQEKNPVRVFSGYISLDFRGLTEMSYGSLYENIVDADMVLIGIGEEFDDIRCIKEINGFLELRNKIRASEESWMLPKFDAVYRNRTKSKVIAALEVLLNLIKDKNYFVISTSMNPDVLKANWKEERFVAPCGSCLLKQCVNRCAEGLIKVSESEDKIMDEFVENIYLGNEAVNLGNCPECGGRLVLNNVYASGYDENGYLTQWNIYTKWLQGTLNKKLLILELGVGVDYPSVIRFPFEKIAFYNNKASFFRVNEILYQLPPELSEKGNSIAENSIDWLVAMC